MLAADFCRSLYKEIISIEGGKIVWSFVKPLIVGKILYTPPNLAVHKVIEKVGFSNFLHFYYDSGRKRR